jgi:DNA-binding NarL/FixJ family response regulator
VTGALRFLLVEDHLPLATAWLHAIRRETGANVLLAATNREARPHLRSGGLAGLITDVTLPDGCGLERALEALDAGCLRGARVLVVTGDADRFHDAINRSFGRFDVLLKPVGSELVVGWCRRTIAGDERLALANRVQTATGAVAEDRRLSSREREAAQLVMRGVRSSDLHLHLGVSERRAEDIVSALLRKLTDPADVIYAELCGHGAPRDVGDVRVKVLLQALRGKRP